MPRTKLTTYIELPDGKKLQVPWSEVILVRDADGNQHRSLRTRPDITARWEKYSAEKKKEDEEKDSDDEEETSDEEEGEEEDEEETASEDEESVKRVRLADADSDDADCIEKPAEIVDVTT